MRTEGKRKLPVMSDLTHPTGSTAQASEADPLEATFTTKAGATATLNWAKPRALTFTTEEPGRTLPNSGAAVHAVAGCTGTALQNGHGQDTAFRFVVPTTMTSVIKGVHRVAVANTLYSISARTKRGDSLIPDPTGHDLTMTVHPTAEYANVIANTAWKGVCTPRPEFDFAAIVERLAAAVTKYALWGQLTAKDLCSAGSVSARMLAHNNTSVTGVTDVYLPASTWYADRGLTATIALAATGAGATVVVDPMPVDSHGRPTIADEANDALAFSAYRALVYLGRLYDYAGAGSHFAYALTRGLHSSATVLGHTDEGAYVRTVLRRGRFAAPYGVMLPQPVTNWAGLPSLPASNPAALQNTVFSMLLTTAAAVAVSDPTVTIEGRSYPEVFCVDTANTVTFIAAKRSEVPEGEVQRAAAQLIASRAARFADLYIYALTKLFGYQTVSYEPATHLTAAFGWFTPVKHTDADGNDSYEVDRHLLRTGHYWYWVEPTGVLLQMFDELPAASIHSGPRAARGLSKTYPALPPIVQAEEVLGASALVCDYQSARQVPAIDFLRESPVDGLAHLRVAHLDPKSLACAGVDTSGGLGSLTDILDEVPSIARLLWERGDARHNAPAELLALAGRTAFLVVHDMAAVNAGPSRPTPLPLPHELAAWTVTYDTSTPRFAGVHAPNTAPALVRQQRGTACRAFNAAAQLYAGASLTSVMWRAGQDAIYTASMLLQSEISAAAFAGEAPELTTAGTKIAEAYTRDTTPQKTAPMPGSLQIAMNPAGNKAPLRAAAPLPGRAPAEGRLMPDAVSSPATTGLPITLFEAGVGGYGAFSLERFDDGTRRYEVPVARRVLPRGETGPVPEGGLLLVNPADTSVGRVIATIQPSNTRTLGTLQEGADLQGVTRPDGVVKSDATKVSHAYSDFVRVREFTSNAALADAVVAMGGAMTGEADYAIAVLPAEHGQGGDQ